MVGNQQQRKKKCGRRFKSDIMLEVGFKPNSTPQNQLVSTYILWNCIISSRCGTSNTLPHAEVYSSHAWDKKLVGDPLAARYRVEQNVQESSLG